MKLVIAILAVFGILLFGTSFVYQVSRVKSFAGDGQWFIGGALIAGTVAIFVRHSSGRRAFLHELTHVIWAKLFMGDVQSMYVSRSKGGYAHFAGGLKMGKSLVALAPYFFPLIPSVLLLLRLIVRPEYSVVFSAIIGYTLVSYYRDVVRSMLIPQSDIRGEGLVFSLAVIVCLNIIFTGVIVSGITPGMSVAGFLRAEGSSAYLTRFVAMMFSN